MDLGLGNFHYYLSLTFLFLTIIKVYDFKHGTKDVLFYSLMFFFAFMAHPYVAFFVLLLVLFFFIKKLNIYQALRKIVLFLTFCVLLNLYKLVVMSYTVPAESIFEKSIIKFSYFWLNRFYAYHFINLSIGLSVILILILLAIFFSRKQIKNSIKPFWKQYFYLVVVISLFFEFVPYIILKFFFHVEFLRFFIQSFFLPTRFVLFIILSGLVIASFSLETFMKKISFKKSLLVIVIVILLLMTYFSQPDFNNLTMNINAQDSLENAAQKLKDIDIEPEERVFVKEEHHEGMYFWDVSRINLITSGWGYRSHTDVVFAELDGLISQNVVEEIFSPELETKLEKFNIRYIIIPKSNIKEENQTTKWFIKKDFGEYMLYEYKNHVNSLVIPKNIPNQVEMKFNHYDIYLENEKNQTIILSIAYHKYWNALVDGKKSHLKKSPEGLMEIEMQKGEHHIELTYDSSKNLLAIINLFILLSVVIYLIRKKT